MMKAFPLSNMTGLNQQGMDLRDYFAAKFMQSFMSTFDEDILWDGLEYADIAYQIADAMMKARNAETKED
jgi:hypothetical protein